MKLADVVELLYGGGEGSGCDPAVAESHGTKCGPPGSGERKSLGEARVVAKGIVNERLKTVGSFEDMKAVSDEIEAYVKQTYLTPENLAKFRDRPMLSLYEGDKASVWLLGWRSRKDETPIHDHQDSKAYVKVLKGSVEEEIYHPDWKMIERAGHGSLSVEHRILNEGEGANIPTPYIHTIGNLGGDEMGVTLHTYSPPLKNMKFYERMSLSPGVDSLQETDKWSRDVKGAHCLLCCQGRIRIRSERKGRSDGRCSFQR